MTNRLPSIALYAAMIFIALMLTTPEARAAEAWGGCGAQFATCQNDVTPAGEGTSSGTICTDAFGCLNCTASKDMQSATCSRLYMSSGFCTCTPIGMRLDSRFGREMPYCSLSGSCRFR